MIAKLNGGILEPTPNSFGPPRYKNYYLFDYNHQLIACFATIYWASSNMREEVWANKKEALWNIIFVVNRCQFELTEGKIDDGIFYWCIWSALYGLTNSSSDIKIEIEWSTNWAIFISFANHHRWPYALSDNIKYMQSDRLLSTHPS